MHRIDTPSRQKDKFGAGKDGFTGGNPQTGTPATAVSPDILDALQEEICAVIEDQDSGLTLSKGNNTQLISAIKKIISKNLSKLATLDEVLEAELDDIAVPPKHLPEAISKYAPRGVYANAEIISGQSKKISSSDIGKAFLFTAAGASAVLPAASTVQVGGAVHIQTSAAITLSVTGGEAFLAAISSVTTLAMPSGTEITAISTGSAWWVFGSATAPLLGVNQAWRDVKLSRSANIIYTNSTGRPIGVMITLQGTNALDTWTVVVDTVTVYSGDPGVGSPSTATPISFVVPPGGTYSINGTSGTIVTWSELR